MRAAATASLLLLASSCGTASGEAMELTNKNFDKKVFSNKKAAFVKFLAPW